MFRMTKRKIRSETANYFGDIKIGKLTGNEGTCPQRRLPKKHAHLIGKKAHLFEIAKDGKTEFLISTDEGLNQSTLSLNLSEKPKLPKKEKHGTIVC